MPSENELSREIIRCAIEAHRTLGGPGLLESVYEEALAWELAHAGLNVNRQVQIPIIYKGTTLATHLQLDLVVESKVIIECKATSRHSPLFEAQTLTYLRVAGMKLGLVINFGETLVSRGVHRVVNNL